MRSRALQLRGTALAIINVSRILLEAKPLRAVRGSAGAYLASRILVRLPVAFSRFLFDRPEVSPGAVTGRWVNSA